MDVGPDVNAIRTGFISMSPEGPAARIAAAPGVV